MRVSNMIRVFILIFSVFLFSLVLAKFISPPKTLAAIVCQEHYLDFNSGCYNNLCTSTSRQFNADCTEISALCRAQGRFCDRYTGAQCCQLTHGAATTCTSIDNSDLCYPGGPPDGIRCCWDDGNPVPPPPTPTPSCKGIGGSCTTFTQCCSPNTCINFLCTAPTPTPTPTAGPTPTDS